MNNVNEWLNGCFQSPPKCPLFHRWPDSKWVRSERRTACLTALLTLLRHLELQFPMCARLIGWFLAEQQKSPR